MHLAYWVKYRKVLNIPINMYFSKKTDCLATNSMANGFMFRFICKIRCITSVELIFAKLEIV